MRIAGNSGSECYIMTPEDSTTTKTNRTTNLGNCVCGNVNLYDASNEPLPAGVGY